MALISYVKNKNIKILLLILLFYVIIVNELLAKDIHKTSTQYCTLQVEILGIDPKLAESIKKDLLIFHSSNEEKLPKNRIENLHDKTDEEIIKNLQSLGYYHTEIISSKLQEKENHKWLASYTLKLGAPTKIKQIELAVIGNINNNVELLNNIKKISVQYLKPTEKLSHENYEKTKQIILNTLHDSGFLNATFNKSVVTVNLKEYTANIEFIIDPRQQYYLGKVTFESDRYSEMFLKQYIPFKEHDVYSTDSLMQLKNNLLNSGLFSKVRIDLPTLINLSIDPKDNNNLPITVRTIAKPANNYNGSIGFGTDTGARASLGFSRKRIAHPGHQINFNIMGSKIRKKANIDYSLIGVNPIIDKYNFGVTAVEERIKERYSKNGLFYLQKVKQYTNRQQFWKLNFLTENFKELPTQNKQHTNFLFPSIRLIWTSYNKKDHNGFGNKLDITAKIASKTLGAANLLQLTVHDKLIQPFIYDIRYILKGTFGFTTINNKDKLPLSLRFFAGGDYSVRGFGYESLGPKSIDREGKIGVIGGKHLVLGSLEIEKPIYNQISISYFIDTGNAFNSFNNITKQLAVANGFGVIYKTPIGSVRGYIAKPLKLVNEDTKKSIRFHLTFDAGL